MSDIRHKLNKIVQTVCYIAPFFLVYIVTLLKIVLKCYVLLQTLCYCFRKWNDSKYVFLFAYPSLDLTSELKVNFNLSSISWLFNQAA